MPRARAELAAVVRPRLKRRPAIVFRVDGGRRLTLAPVTSAALLSGAILCAADVPPTLGGSSIAGYGLLATGLWLLRRLLTS
jgi:hypothetical protein